MNISQLLQTYEGQSGEQSNRINEYVARALLHVVHSHIMSVTPSLVLTLCCRDKHTCNFYNHLMSIFFRSSNGNFPLQIVRVEKEVSRRRLVPGRRHYNLIFTDSYAAFAEIQVEAYTRDYNYNERYFIFLQARDHLLPGEMRRIFEHCWRHQLINCNVQVQTASGDIQIYTYQPFGPHSCLDMTPQLINRYNGTHMLHPLFPRKLGNFFGCLLRVAFLGGVAHEANGLEGRLLHALAHRLNFSIDRHQPPPGKGQLANRAIQMLERREVDMCLGGIYQTVARRLLATSTHNYREAGIRFGVLDVSFELSSLDILLFPYPRIIWLAIGVFLLLAILVQLLMDRLLPSHTKRTKLVHLLNLELICVGMPMLIERRPYWSAKRLFCIVLMLFTLLIRNVYQGMLYHLIRTHQLNPIPQSIEELVEHNYVAVLSAVMHDLFAEIPMLQQMRFHLLDDDSSIWNALDYLTAHARDKRLVTAASPDIFLKYNSNPVKGAYKVQANHHFELIPQDVMHVQLAIHLQKHSFLIDEFNQQIMWMRSTGLLGLWTSLDYGKDNLHSDSLSNYKMFGLQQLYVLFLLLFIGLLLSTLLFGLELLSLRFVRLQRYFQA